MTFTKEQLDILSKYEESFRTAVGHNWARNISAISAREIHDIWAKVEPKVPAFYPSCGTCTLNLLKAVGRIYFADKQEVKAQVALEERDVTAAKAEVKTRRTRKTATTEE